MEKPICAKVRVKPVYGAIIHKDAKEGPCRTGDDFSLQMSPQAERKRGKDNFKKFVKGIEDNITKEAEILKPVHIEYEEGFHVKVYKGYGKEFRTKKFQVKEKEFKELNNDLEKVDLFLVGRKIPGIERYKKPIATMAGLVDVDTSAFLRSRGLEGYAPFDFDELNELISLLRVRKAMSQTKILKVSSGEFLPWVVTANVYDFERLKDKFGVDCKTILFKEFFEEMDKVIKEQRIANDITHRLIKGAQKVHMKEEYVKNDVYLYLTAKNLMGKYGCNAFTMPSAETCLAARTESRQFTPCLALALLKDEGYPSPCDADISVFLSMSLLMYLSKKSAYMGNPHVAKSKDKNIIDIIHDSAGLKMYGLESKDLPYEIRNFANGGWGTTIRYDFSRDKGKTVTLGRFDPLAKKMLLIKGEVVRGLGFNGTSCSLGLEIRVSNAMRYFHLSSDFGHHLAMVYGDYTEEVKKLGNLMNFEVVEV